MGKLNISPHRVKNKQYRKYINTIKDTFKSTTEVNETEIAKQENEVLPTNEN